MACTNTRFYKKRKKGSTASTKKYNHLVEIIVQVETIGHARHFGQLIVEFHSSAFCARNLLGSAFLLR